jgi:hypothetical protein
MKALLTVCLLLILATTASAASLPWTKFNDPDMLAANTFARPAVCYVDGDVKQIFAAGFLTDTAVYIMVYELESRRIVFAVGPPEKDSLTEIGFGTVDADDNNTIPALRWQPFVEEIHNDTCRNLFPSTT